MKSAAALNTSREGQQNSSRKSGNNNNLIGGRPTNKRLSDATKQDRATAEKMELIKMIRVEYNLIRPSNKELSKKEKRMIWGGIVTKCKARGHGWTAKPYALRHLRKTKWPRIKMDALNHQKAGEANLTEVDKMVLAFIENREEEEEEEEEEEVDDEEGEQEQLEMNSPAGRTSMGKDFYSMMVPMDISATTTSSTPSPLVKKKRLTAKNDEIILVENNREGEGDKVGIGSLQQKQLLVAELHLCEQKIRSNAAEANFYREKTLECEMKAGILKIKRKVLAELVGSNDGEEETQGEKMIN